MRTNSNLWEHLPRTPGSQVSEAPRVILGLHGFGIFFVFGAFALTMLITDLFPMALVISIAVFAFIRRMIDSKPRGHLRHLLLFHLVIPKHYGHRLRDREFPDARISPIPSKNKP